MKLVGQLRQLTNYTFNRKCTTAETKNYLKEMQFILIPLYLGGTEQCTVSLETLVLILALPVTSHVVGLQKVI